MFQQPDEGLYQHQMSFYQSLLLGLPIRTGAAALLTCTCDQPWDLFGYHSLNCKQHAGHAFHAAHDVVRDQLSRELRRLELRRGICDDES
jgi:hypothetical protein